MKLPEDIYYPNDDSYVRLLKLWRDNAEQLSVETGIFIEVHITYPTGKNYINRIFFKVDDHEFEGLNEVKRAIEMKAFL
jgi:hypothetical protein